MLSFVLFCTIQLIIINTVRELLLCFFAFTHCSYYYYYSCFHLIHLNIYIQTASVIHMMLPGIVTYNILSSPISFRVGFSLVLLLFFSTYCEPCCSLIECLYNLLRDSLPSAEYWIKWWKDHLQNLVNFIHQRISLVIFEIYLFALLRMCAQYEAKTSRWKLNLFSLSSDEFTWMRGNWLVRLC